MAVTKSEPDGQHPSSHYLYVGDPDKPTTWKLRYKNAQGEVDPRLLGACHAALTVGYRGNKVDLPAADKARCLGRLKALYRRANMPWPDDQHADTEQLPVDLGDVATFALGEEDVGGDDAMVVRTGLIFKAGDYRPKRDFAITAEELSAVAATFNDDVPNELEHFQSQGYKTFLDGRLGRLVAIWTSEDGAELFGDVEVPRWLDRLWAEAGRKVSTVWDTAADGAKRLVRLGLVLNPVVQEAALFAEYAAFAGQRHSAGDLRDLQAIHDITIKQGATCPDPPMTSPTFSDDRTGDTTVPEEKKPDAPATTANDAALATMQTQFAEMQSAFAQMKTAMEGEIAALKSKNADLEAKNQTLFADYAAERTRRLHSEAIAFADAQIAAGKAFTYERQTLAQRYVLAVEDDTHRGPIVFGENQETTRQKLLEEEFAAKRPHGLTGERMALADGAGQERQVTHLFGLSNLEHTPQAAADEPTPEQREARKRELLQMSDLGRRVAAAQNGK